MIHRYLTMEDEKLDTLIMVSALELLTTDQALYEAMASIEDRNLINMNKLTKLLEVTQIVSHKNLNQKERYVLTHEKAAEIRNNAKKLEV